MSTSDKMSSRPISVRDREWLAGEISYWQAASLVSPEQAAEILRQYASEEQHAAGRRNLFLAALVSLAAILFGAAAFLLVGFNWQELPAAAKLSIIFGVLAITYSAAFALRLKFKKVGLSNVVFLLGGLFYGAAIWLVAQIFHMDAHYPDAFFWWAVGLLPLALLLDTVLLHVLLAAVLALWISTEVLNFAHLGNVFFGFRIPWIPNGVYWAPVMAAPGLYWAYRRGSIWAVAAYVPLLAYWAILQPIAWRWEANPAFFIGAVGAVLLIAAESHPVRHAAGIVCRVYGSLLVGGALMPLGFYQFNTSVMRWEYSLQHIGTAILILTFAAAALAIAEYLRYRFLERGEMTAAKVIERVRIRQWFPLAVAGVFGAMALVSVINDNQAPSLNNIDPPAALIVTIAANAAMIAVSLWLMWVGLREDRGTPFGAGVSYFLIWVVVRYIDLFGGAGGMLGAAGLFFLCGLALVGVAYFWRSRKQVSYGT